MDSPPPQAKPETISELLKQLQAALHGGGALTVGAMLHLFGVRGFAFFLFVLALMNMVIFMLPGLSILFGLPMVILAVQMVLGLRAPIFPRFIRHRTVRRDVLSRGLALGIRGMQKTEYLLRPRFLILSGPHLDRLHSMLALVLSMMVVLPIPFLNLPPSLGVVVLALGLMQRDGAFIAASYVIAGWSLWLFGSLSHVAQALAG